MVPGTLGGRLDNAAQVGGIGRGTVEAQGGDLPSGSIVTDLDSAQWQDDYFTLSVDGPQDLALTYLPMTMSEDVKCWGDGQERGVDWDRATGSQALSILA